MRLAARLAGLAVIALGACSNDPPKPDGIVVVSNHVPAQLVADATYVYWTDDSGGIWKTPLEAPDTAPISVVDRSLTKDPYALAIDATSLYWSDVPIGFSNDGSINKVDLAGGMPVVLVPQNGRAISLAVDDSRVYWTNEQYVLAVPKTGGLIERIAVAEQDAQYIVVDTTHLYWTDSGQHAIRSIDLHDPNAMPKTIAAADAPLHIAVDTASVYFLDFDNQLHLSLKKIPLAGGTPVTLDTRSSPSGFRSGGIATDGANAYWTTDSAVFRVAVDGSGATSLADHNGDIHCMTMGPRDVLWCAAAGGSEVIRRTPK
jgi:hypothetical protein